MDIKQLGTLLSKSKEIVCICGREMSYHCGYPEYWTQDYSYYFENKYKKSLEEVLNIGFYKTRTLEFFTIYKEEFLQYKFKPSQSFYKLSYLEKQGKLKAVITKDIFSLSQRAGCKEVLDLYGNIYENYCSKCGQKYSTHFIRQSKGIPKCLECNSTIRPQIKLYGELIDNYKLTMAKNLISSADLLLVLDTDFNGEFSNYFDHSQNIKTVLIKERHHDSDKKANYVIYDKSENVLSKLKDEKLHMIYENLVAVNK